MSPASYQTAPPRVDLVVTRVRAGNGTRTRDPNLGKVVLYQLSYSRKASGGEGNRTPDLVNAIHALSQLSYAPAPAAARARGIGRGVAGKHPSEARGRCQGECYLHAPSAFGLGEDPGQFPQDPPAYRKGFRQLLATRYAKCLQVWPYVIRGRFAE